jgi:integrase
MLSADIRHYVEFHRTMGLKFKLQEGLLRHFAAFAEPRGDRWVRAETVLAWATQAPSAPQRRNRLLVVRRFALEMQAEDDRYEVPPALAFGKPKRERRTPHIYSPDDVSRLLRVAAALRPEESIRPATYTTLLALIAATGLRISEVLALQLSDFRGSHLVIRNTKFRKSRLVPLHPTAKEGLERYLTRRRKVPGTDSSFFVSIAGTGLCYSTAYSVFLQLMRSSGLRQGPGTPGPCIHDLRHTFAVRSLERCALGDQEIGCHVLALSTYLGHTHPSDTYWYFQATPKLLERIGHRTESLFAGGAA